MVPFVEAGADCRFGGDGEARAITGFEATWREVLDIFRLALPEPLEGVFSSTIDEDYDFFEPLPHLESGYIRKCAVLRVLGEDELAGTSSVVC